MINFRYLILLLFSTFSLKAQTIHPHYEDGNIYIKINEDAVPNMNESNYSIRDFSFLNDFTNAYSVTDFKHLYAFAKNRGLENIYKISIAEKNLIDQCVRELNSIKQLEYAEKVPYKTYFAVPPNDTSYNNTLQWNLFKINALIAWNFIGNPSPSQTILAVIDDGLDINHIDLKDNLWVNQAERYGLPGIDDDGNFIVDDSLGYDFGNFDTDPSPNDVLWHHGTHVAGIAGAVTNNTTGIASIAYNARLMAVKGSSSNLYVSNGYEAIAYAADNGADVINLSWGAPVESITESNTILYAYFLGAVVVSAAGNTNDGTVNYPAAYPHVISVASTSSNDTKAVGTTYGQWIDVCAPGVNIFSTIPGNGFALMSGTSMASPLVAGLAALMKTFNPLLSPDQIEDCIKYNTDNIDFMNPGYPGKLGTGRINAFKTMQCVNETRYQIDASLKRFELPDAYSCSSNFIPKVALKNSGTNHLLNVSVSYNIDGGAFNTIYWSGDMEYDSIQILELLPVSLTSGEHTIKAFCSNPNQQLDWNFGNDTIQTVFKIYNSGISLPFVEDFENGFQNYSWRIDNTDGDKTWEVKTGTIDGVTNKAAFINLFNYSEKGERDGMITPPLNFSGYDSVRVQFEYAWKRNFRQESDSLILYISTDCGASFSNRLAVFYQDSLVAFATEADTMDNYFNPTQAAAWCGNILSCIDVDLTAFAGLSSVLLKFESFNNFNNNLYIDNINVFGVSDAVAAPQANFITANTTSICEGELITFTANDPNNTSTGWEWNFSNGVPSTATGQSVTIQFNNQGNVSASLIAGNSIGNSTVSLSSPITINALPNVNILQNDTSICHDNSISLSVTGASSYVWSPAVGLSDTIGSTVTALPQVPVSYIVTGTSTAGCVNFDTINIDTTVCLGVFALNQQAQSRVFYNNSSGYITIVAGDKDISNGYVALYNALGQKIVNVPVNVNSGCTKQLIDCNLLSNGIYFATLHTNNQKPNTNKILIQTH